MKIEDVCEDEIENVFVEDDLFLLRTVYDFVGEIFSSGYVIHEFVSTV